MRKIVIASKTYEVSVKGHFYPFKEEELLKYARSCKCNRYDCMKCCCRNEAVRAKLLTEDEADEIVFGK